MKRETSVRNAKTIAARLVRLGGIVGTPDCRFEAIRISRMWLFGSTVKGKDCPNDTDILVEYKIAGRYRSAHKRQIAYDKTFAGYGKSPETSAFRSLRKGLKMVRYHRFTIDGDIAHPRVMIYPRCDLI